MIAAGLVCFVRGHGGAELAGGAHIAKLQWHHVSCSMHCPRNKVGRCGTHTDDAYFVLIQETKRKRKKTMYMGKCYTCAKGYFELHVAEYKSRALLAENQLEEIVILIHAFAMPKYIINL
jgi:hypothetical protein